MNRLAASAFAAALLAGCATFAAVAAPPVFTSAPLPASVTSDLPRTARPLHYRIEVTPDAGNLTFAGTASIDLEIYDTVDAVTLSANELDISSARLFAAGSNTAIPLTVTLDPEKQTARFAAPGPIAPGTYRIDTVYTGKILTQPSGLFALDYPDKRTGQTVRGLFTQFEAPDARRFAPMFDEPSYKATFDLSAVVPANQMAVSNMPIASEQPLRGGRKRVTFGTTPKMSSYLLFFGIGDYERMALKGPHGVDVGIVSPAGSGEQARYAVEILPDLLTYYEDYFGVPYPLPKLDNIAAPGQSQSFGAMENWGAILTFEGNLLIDPAITSPARQDYMWTAQAHEVAHQWFGDIVTMAWWDDLWLNEGFASWMETKAKDHFHPEWSALLTRVEGRERAMSLDSFATTHPVIQQIRTVEESNTAFDSIAYSKGEAVISMLEAYAGEATWRDGIRTYMDRHKYSNTTSNDLWRAVEEAGAPGLVTIAHDFTLQPGVPLVRAEARCVGGNTTLDLTQSEFSRDRKEQVAANPQRWHVPLIIQPAGGQPVRQMLDGSASVNLPGCAPVVVNGGQLGYFRTLYSPAMSAQLTQALPTLAPIDQLGLLRDSYSLAEADYQPLAPALAMLMAVPGDANAVVAQGAVARWVALYGVASEGDRAKIAALTRDRWLPRLQELGFEPKASDTLTDANLRSDLITALGNMGDETVAGEARHRFAALASDPRAMDGPLKTTWLGIIARNATLTEWERLLELARTSTSQVERQAYFTLLGSTTDPALAKRAFDFALTGEAGTVSPRIMTAVAGGNADFAFDYAMANRRGVEALIDTFGQASFIAGLAVTARDPAMIGKLEALRDSVPQDQHRAIERRIAALKQRFESEPRMREQLGALLAGGERG